MNSNTSQKLLASFILVILLKSGSALAGITLVDKDNWKVMFGGFVELDMFSDSTRSLTEVAGSNPIDRGGSYNGDNGRTQFSLRNTRFNFTILPPTEGEWKTKGFVEYDLLGYEPSPAAGVISESNFATSPTLRLRHAYLSAEKDGLQFLAGQTWTLFGWVPAYVLTTASVPPVAGTLYERTPQLTVIKTANLSESHRLQTGFSIVRPVQRDSQIPGLDAGVRMLFGERRAGFVSPTGDLKAEAMSLAVSGTAREFVTPRANAGTGEKSHYLGSAIAVNGMLPLLASTNEKEYGNTLALSGEFTSGQGYGDEFSGWSGNVPQLPSAAAPGNTTNLDAGQGGFDSTGTFHLIHLKTWNAQLQYHFPAECRSFMNLGYGQLYSNNVGSQTPSTGKFIYDRPEVYFANFFHDFTSQLRAAVEIDHFSTHYADGNFGRDNRVQVSAWLRF